uniref:Cytochrome P450 family 2 subfamily D member 6/pseudo n=1 Tax=Phocoena sinus TaxID=42100 RepID=A0A8C9BIQ4_PHOSS
MLLTGDTLATLAVAVAVFLLLVDQMHRHSRWAARYPPGPMPLPGLGNLLQVNFQDPLLSFSQVLEAIPVLLRIPGLAARVFPGQRAFMVLIDELVIEHRVTQDRAQPPRDLTDAFLDEVEVKGTPRAASRLVVSDLFSAGVITTSATLAWALLLMILHPDVQQKPIDEVIGQVRQPEMGDQALVPFTMAVVHEVQCFGDIIALGLPHMTSRDIEVQGFLIPKGTTLITNLSSVLKDETIWKKPSHFHPEHFLDAQGRFVKQRAPMPAHRPPLVPWEPLACMERFLFFTSLLQHLSFSVPTGQPRPSGHGVFAFLVTPSPYQLCALPC